MQHTKKTSKPERIYAILTADWHLREDVPVCRTDDFLKAQWDKVRYIKELQEKLDCIVVHAGDFFHHWKPSPALLTETMRNIPKEFYTVYGNHDLPQHNMELADKSGVATLIEAGVIKLFPGGHWNTEPEGLFFPQSELLLMALHIMTWKGDLPYPGCTAPDASRLLRKYPEANILVTGDNHKSFTIRIGNRWLVNPGSLTRQTADQVDHAPVVYLWDGVEVFPEYLPAPRNAVSREHIEQVERRDARIEAFISRLDGEWEAGVSFVENLRRFAEKNEVSDQVMNIIYQSIDKT